MKRRPLVFAAVAVLFALLGILLGTWRMTPAPAEPAAVDLLFSSTMPDPQGHPQAMKQWQGKPLVVNFWATWCAPCIEEMPELSDLHAELSPRGSEVLGIGIDSADNIAGFASKYEIRFPLLVGGAGATELARRFGNKTGGLPFTVLLDAQGQVRKTYLGRLKMDELRRDLANL